MCRSECAIKAKADKLIHIMKAFAYCGCICTPVSDPSIAIILKELVLRQELRKCFKTSTLPQRDASWLAIRPNVHSMASKYPRISISLGLGN